ncbi:MAG: DPP IV N-terminal domain-containing protein [Bacteroidales bacterium]|nr:DPP IV N-terminal domain-containing protein [Bacteroidales bacterium]
MKKRVAALLLMILSFSFMYAQEKIHFTDEQLANGNFPKGLFNTPEARRSTMPVAAPRAQLVPGWQNPTYSPDSTRIAYTLNNDLYSIEVATQKITRHTYTGSELSLNGYASWVYYEEILGRSSNYKAFWWSPDSKIIAFYHFDNTPVPMFPIYLAEGQHGSLNETRYPKAGDENPKVKIGFVSVNGGETVWADFDENVDQYFGIPFWNGEGDRFMVSWMDRAQDNLKLYSVDPTYGNKYEIYSEHQDTWIDWMEQMLFTKEGIYFVRDNTMWEQVYYLTYDGKTFKQLTQGENWGIRLLKVDKKYLYFTAKRESTVRTDIYRITLRNNALDRLSYGDLSFSGVRIEDNGTKIYASASNLHTPTQSVLISIPNNDIRRKTVEVLSDLKGPDFDKYAIAIPELVYVTLRDGRKLPATVTWPVDMDTTGAVKYPVIVNIYGGPNSAQVSDTWKGVSFDNQWWPNHGVIQITLDTRSAGHFGKAGMNEVYRYLSVHELEDFIDGISNFRDLPYVNEKKVGITGFSYGGTMSLLCATEGSEYFQYAISGAGVMDWKLYDTHYAERYMDRPQDNPDGYKASAVFDRLKNYKGDKTNFIRMTHGTGDDNVHFQNTLQTIDALMSLNKDFELMIYPQGKHGYRGYQQKQYQLQNFRFWYQYLLEQDLPDIIRNR